LLPRAGGRREWNSCAAMADQGFNGIEQDVVTKIAEWMTRK